MSHGKFSDKIVETWDICDFFSPCLTPFLLSWSALFCLPRGLPAGTHTGKAPFPPSASTPQASGFAESHSQSSSSLYFGNTGAHLLPGGQRVTQLIYGNLLHAPDHSSPVAPAEEPKISCFPHKSQSPVSKFVASEGLRCDPGYGELLKATWCSILSLPLWGPLLKWQAQDSPESCRGSPQRYSETDNSQRMAKEGEDIPYFSLKISCSSLPEKHTNSEMTSLFF